MGTYSERRAETAKRRAALKDNWPESIKRRNFKELTGRLMIGLAVVLLIAILATVLLMDGAILSQGQMGFLTPVLYYPVYVACAVLYWFGVYLSGHRRWTFVALAIWLILGAWPLLLPMYGFGGPT